MSIVFGIGCFAIAIFAIIWAITYKPKSKRRNKFEFPRLFPKKVKRSRIDRDTGRYL